METSVILSFMAVSIVLALTPGPDILFVGAQSIAFGKKAGFFTVLGLCTGLLVHTSAAAFGLAAIILNSVLLFQLIKYAGVAYLLLLAIRSLVEAGRGQEEVRAASLSLSQLYRRGILMNLLNPKVSLFFLALLPQFVKPAAGNIQLQMLILGLVFQLTTVLVFGCVAFFAGMAGQGLLKNPKAAKGLKVLNAVIFILIALNLIFSLEKHIS